MSGRRRTILGGLGIAATLVGMLAVVQPALVAGTEPFASLVSLLSDVGIRKLLLLATVLVGLSLVRSTARLDGTTADGDRDPAARFERSLDAPPERVTVDRATPTASEFDAAVERAVAGDETARERVRERLAAVAAARLVRHRDHTRESAERAVATGTWTRDPVAAAFLAGPDGPVQTRRSRLRLWLDPDTERRRRLVRTVDAIEALDGQPGARRPRAPGTADTGENWWAGTSGERGESSRASTGNETGANPESAGRWAR